MSFRIEHRSRSAGSGSGAEYGIFYKDRLIAVYWIDHRGDGHGIRFLGRQKQFPFRPNKEDYPLDGRPNDFIEGGGPKPLELTAKAIAYLNAEKDRGTF
ncbi:MAG: hypothetical protein QNI99_10565 [Woeseiaceae bacterium]|nr:hypothetical protein [Woeseiaceae bacterium]